MPESLDAVQVTDAGYLRLLGQATAIVTKLDLDRIAANALNRHFGSACAGLRCCESHHLGGLNAGRFGGDTPLCGQDSPGRLMGEWDVHAGRYVKLYGAFAADLEGGVLSVDLSAALPSES